MLYHNTRKFHDMHTCYVHVSIQNMITYKMYKLTTQYKAPKFLNYEFFKNIKVY